MKNIKVFLNTWGLHWGLKYLNIFTVLQVNDIAVYRIILLDIVVPKGIRTPVAAVKGQCPRPLDDGDLTV